MKITIKWRGVFLTAGFIMLGVNYDFSALAWIGLFFVWLSIPIGDN